VTYNGYTIRPSPQHLVENGMWGLDLHIGWSTKDGEKSRHFSTSDQYVTEKEAIAHCLTYGQQIIDGKISGIVL
jgi:hypothetical protein